MSEDGQLRRIHLVMQANKYFSLLICTDQPVQPGASNPFCRQPAAVFFSHIKLVLVINQPIVFSLTENQHHLQPSEKTEVLTRKFILLVDQFRHMLLAPYQ